LDWVNKGAQPTDTCRAILSYKGILYKKHLEGGVKKGALTEEQAEAKFAQWLEGKAGKIEGKKDILTKSKEELKKATLTAEAKKKEEMAAAIIAKNTPAPEVEETVVEEAPEVEEAAEVEVSAEEAAPVAEVEASAEVEEAAPVAEEAPVVEEAAPVAEEAPVVEEVAPVVEVEAAEEAPAAEATEEAPSDEKAV
jgi:small subunit ribosomal protein S16